MDHNSRGYRSSPSPSKSSVQESGTPRSRSNSHLTVPVISPLLRGRLLTPVFDEFSLRRTPSRGATASPTPAKGVRKRLNPYRNFGHAVDLLKSSANIVVLTGAGISTSVGIPDFRSDKGLYSQLSKDLGITEAEEFFSREYFISSTEQFYQYVKKVIPEAIVGSDGTFKATNPRDASKDGRVSVPKFSLTHAFLALLHSKRKLLTNYTQNIDGLEVAAGVPKSMFVQCHGSWDTASCLTCGRSSAAKKYLPIVFSGNIPFCKCKFEAKAKNKTKSKKSGKKRSWDDFDSDHSSDDGTQAPRGLLKPDITFFNERLSGSYDERLNHDKRQIDLLIIIGTSLKVGPVQDMLYQISPKVPQIFISKERFSGALCNLPGVQVDIELLGECDVIIEELCRRAGWSKDLESLLWEEGQTKIKAVTKEMTVQQTKIASHLEDRRDSSSMFRSDVSPRKRLKTDTPLSVDGTGDTDVWETKSEGPVPVVIRATASVRSGQQRAQQGSQIGKSNLAIESKLDDEDDDDDATSQKQGSSSSARITVPEMIRGPSPTAEGRDGRVKIELVEGTTHQWRITRK